MVQRRSDPNPFIAASVEAAMDSLILDVKYAVRSIVTAPKFAAVVLLTLALGIGANTAVFTVLNAVVLEPLPYAEPEQLVRVYHSIGNDNTYLTGLAAIGYRDRSRTLDIAVTSTYSVGGVDLTGRGEPERVTMLPVGADYFRVLRARLAQISRCENRRHRRDPDAQRHPVSHRRCTSCRLRRPDRVGRGCLDAAQSAARRSQFGRQLLSEHHRAPEAGGNDRSGAGGTRDAGCGDADSECAGAIAMVGARGAAADRHRG